jgi:Tfp pilus assembly protein PilP
VPAKSKKQERFMQAVANNPKFAKKVGVPQSVGKEFTKVKKYQEGGMTEEDKKMFGEKETDLPPPKEFKKSDDKKPVPADKKDSLGKLPTEVRNKMGYMKKGGKVKQMKKGGKVYSKDGCAVRGKTKGKLY